MPSMQSLAHRRRLLALVSTCILYCNIQQAYLIRMRALLARYSTNICLACVIAMAASRPNVAGMAGLLNVAKLQRQYRSKYPVKPRQQGWQVARSGPARFPG